MASVSAADTSLGTSIGAALGGGSLDRQAFLKLLVTQLRNQDPIEPQSNTEFLAQLAQFSQLEESQSLNQTLQAQTLMQQLTFGASLAGHQIRYVDANGADQTGMVDSVRVDSSGLLLRVNGGDVPLGKVFEILSSTPPPAGS
ncbi:MAG: hypothetical protein HYR85_06310 [Planctomycetes bacterium]|nr:hypothetical protein [Planctomycetota bacterium]MBI3843042.1 hypothetical protein [Planctomycetota bacterium]